VPQVIGGGTLLVTLSPQLAGLTAMVATVYLGLANVYGRYTRRLAATVQDAIASTNQVPRIRSRSRRESTQTVV
jgi:hypothetical protein